MAIRKGLPAKSAATDADDTRYLFSGLVACNVDGSPRGGVLSPAGVNIVNSTATMNVSVARFQGAAVRDGGVVLLANDGAANVLLDAAPGANSRIDVIYAKQNDSSATVTVPDANNIPMLSFVKGTAGAVPVKPTLPIGALELATVLIPADATATNSGGVVITQTAPFTASAGGVVPFRTKSDMDLWTTAPALQHATDLSASVAYRRVSGVWVPWSSPWKTFTPTLAGFTVGTGGSASSVSEWRYEGDLVHVRSAYTLGTSGGAVSGIPKSTLPVAQSALATPYQWMGTSILYDTSAATPYITAILAANTSTTEVQVVPVNSGGVASAVSPSAPFVWAAGDRITLDFTYRPA